MEYEKSREELIKEIEDLRKKIAQLHSLKLESKEEKEAFQECEANFRRMVEKSTYGMVIVDREGVVRFVNPSAEVILGRKREELIGHPFGFQLVSGETKEIEIPREGGISVGEMQITEIIWEDEPSYLVSLHDITERKQKEAVLRQAYRTLRDTQVELIQSEKMAAVGQLAAGIAHEINNALTYLIANLGFLKGYLGHLLEVVSQLDEISSKVNSPDTKGLENFSQYFQSIRKKLKLEYIEKELPKVIDESVDGAKRIKEIVSALREFAHPSIGEFISTDINEVIEKALLLVWNVLKHKCDVTKNLQPNLYLDCDPVQLSQVFVNLLLNAAQAMEDKRGRVTIKTYSKDSYIYIEIADNGKGIPPQHLNKIFDPFFTTKKKGTGLGLSISYNIIKEHRGTIEVRSKPGEGSTFTIKLPKSKFSTS